jgi:hypothetical protein
MAWPWECELPALADKSSQEVANAINAMTKLVPCGIQSNDLILWGSNGAAVDKPSRIVRIKLASELKPPYESIGYAAQGSACASVAMFSGAVGEFHWYEPTQMKLVGFLVTAGVLSAAELLELTDGHGYTTAPKYSRCEAPLVEEVRARG